MRIIGVVFMDRKSAIMPFETNCISDVLAHQRDVLIVGKLQRQTDLDLARELRVLALLGSLDFVPKRLAIREPLGRPQREHDLGVLDTLLSRVVVRQAIALIVQRLARAIGGGRNHALSFCARDDFRR